MKALLIEAEATLALVEFPDKGTALRQFYSYIGCQSIGCVRVTDKVDMWVDDEFLLVSPTPEFNMLASHLAGQRIHGNAVLIRNTPWGETAGIEPEDIATLLAGALVLGPAYTEAEIAESREAGSWHLEGKDVKAADTSKDLAAWF